MKILILEDDMNRMKQFNERMDELNSHTTFDCEMVHVETAKECIEQLESNKFDLILLDHDLGGKVFVNTNDINTGSEVARWMNKNFSKIKNTAIVTHTFNPAGAQSIIALIPQCTHIPGIWEKNLFHKIIKIN